MLRHFCRRLSRMEWHVRHMRSARKHGVSRSRRESAVRNAVAVVRVGVSPTTGLQRRMVLGDDDNGVPLEIGVVYESGQVVVIHAMELRGKFKQPYEEAKRRWASD